MALGDFRLLLMQFCYLKMNMHLVPACLAFLPSLPLGRLILQELDLVQQKQTVPALKSEISSYNL